MKIRHMGQKKEYIVVTVEGRMDAVSAPEFEKFLNGLIDEGALKVIVDFEGLDYISSAGSPKRLDYRKKDTEQERGNFDCVPSRYGQGNI